MWYRSLLSFITILKPFRTLFYLPTVSLARTACMPRRLSCSACVNFFINKNGGEKYNNKKTIKSERKIETNKLTKQIKSLANHYHTIYDIFYYEPELPD